MSSIHIVGPDGTFDWGAPGKEVFRFWIDKTREVDVHLLGRRLYETMLYSETADQDPSLGDAELEWAALWNPLPKVVFSRTLSSVQGAAHLASGGLAEEIERLRAEPGEGQIAIGGATLAAEAAALGLIDEYHVMVYPVLEVAHRSSPGASAGWISNSSRPAPSTRESSTSATAWRASRFVRRALSVYGQDTQSADREGGWALVGKLRTRPSARGLLAPLARVYADGA